jgi:hypothetical protein
LKISLDGNFLRMDPTAVKQPMLPTLRGLSNFVHGGEFGKLGPLLAASFSSGWSSTAVFGLQIF